jgi:hypothetical protein
LSAKTAHGLILTNYIEGKSFIWIVILNTTLNIFSIENGGLHADQSAYKDFDFCQDEHFFQLIDKFELDLKKAEQYLQICFTGGKGNNFE